MSIDLLLKKAHAKHMQGKHAAAVKLYREILKARPNHLDANYLLGTVYAETGCFPEAKHFLDKADKINSASPYIKVNLGNICTVLGEVATARSYYLQALELDKNLPQALFALGHIADSVDHDIDAALHYYQQAIDLSPNNPDVLYSVGKCIVKFGNPVVIDYFKRALALNPGLPGIHKHLGLACLKAKRNREAATYLRQALQETPDDVQIRYYLCIANGEMPDEDLQNAYVRDEFDKYAGQFDSTLVDKLSYSMPQQLAEFLRDTLGEVRFECCADLGCGTGLVGEVLRSFVDRLEGIDISPGMIAVAATRNCYDRLHSGEIIATLDSCDDLFDLFVATDVIVYCGELQKLFSVITAKAKPGALFVFSTESCAGDGYILQESGRYAHSKDYIKAIVAACGGRVLHTRQIQLRKEHGDWIMGDLFLIKLK